MALRIILAATLRKFVSGYDPLQGHSVDLSGPESVGELIQRLGIPPDEVKLIMVDGVAANRETLLQGDERVGLFPPVGGG